MNIMNGEKAVIRLLIAAVLLMVIVSVFFVIRDVGQSAKNPNAPLFCENSTAVPSIELGTSCR
jgi:hypothetical protein